MELEPPESQSENWKFGAIYYAKNDKRFVVPRTSGIGWTVNFARPLIWVLSVGLLSWIVYMMAI